MEPETITGGGHEMTDADMLLVKRAQKGDAAAFETLYSQHLKRVYNIAWGMMGNGADAEDAAQEVMLKAWRALSSFKLGSAFGTWLYRITMNACADALRRRKKTVSMEEMRENGREPAIEGFEQQSAEGGSLARALARLGEEYRAAIVLRDVQGYAYEEIAVILRCPIGTVRSRISRAREQMRSLLYADGTIRDAVSSKAVERDRT
jgi:RNA polymerase sigma-70 factor (ECF subfamily)